MQHADDNYRQINSDRLLEWEKVNLTQGNPRDSGVVLGYIASFLTAHVLEQAGSTLTRENVLNIATHLNNLRVPMLLPGIAVTTSPADYSVINKFQIQRFQSGSWVPIGKTISG
jgi:branched-chain amino acid transport system substrate-binding protein